MRNRVKFILFLNQQAKKYRGDIEETLGQCDQRFVLGSIKKSIKDDGGPHTQYPNEFHCKGDCLVDIHIGKEPWQKFDYDRATWQLAHESVHLLNPVKCGEATFLEEGLATWFQNEPKFHSREVQEYIKDNQSRKDSPDCYDKAEELVRRCMPQLTSAVKEIRSSGVRIQKITAGDLAPYLPNVDEETIEHLCRKMDYT